MMNRKYIITILGVSTLLIASTSFSFAQTAASPVYPSVRKDLRINVTKTPGVGNQSLTGIQQRADQLITQRLESLNAMLTKITAMQRLSAAQKTQLTNNINTDISGLTALKAKIDADIDASTALTDTKSIYTTYRVYAEFEPQTGILAASDALNKTIDQLNQLALKLQTRISSASAAGNNVITLSSLLTDMQSKIADAKNQASISQTTVANLTPSDFNASPSGISTTFKNSRSFLSIARDDLKTAIQDAMKIVLGLKSFKTPITTIPSTTVPAITSTPTPTV